MRKIAIVSDRISDAELSVNTQSIITHMTGNAYFPTPTPSLAEMQVVYDNFETALMQARTGNHTAVAEKNARKAELVTALQTLADYVTLTAKRDEAALVSSGFKLTKERTPAPPLTKPEGLALANGVNPGELEVRINRLTGVRSYQYQFTPDPLTPDSAWKQQMDTACKTVLTGLESNRQYWCRVGAVGTKGQLVYSDALCRMVL